MGRRGRSLAVLAVVAVVAGSLGGCIPGVGMSYAEHKQRLADIVDATYAATLASKPATLGGQQPAIPCRSGGGSGGATGDYAPSGDIEVALGKGTDLERLAERVRRHWEGEGFEITSVDKDLTVLARDGSDYQMSLVFNAEGDKAVIGASGPCATPQSDAEREAPPPFKSIAREDEAR